MTYDRFQMHLIEYPVPDAKWIQLNRWPFDYLSAQLSLSCSKVEESVNIFEKYHSEERSRGGINYFRRARIERLKGNRVAHTADQYAMAKKYVCAKL